jgi:hypothetical protein
LRQDAQSIVGKRVDRVLIWGGGNVALDVYQIQLSNCGSNREDYDCNHSRAEKQLTVRVGAFLEEMLLGRPARLSRALESKPEAHVKVAESRGRTVNKDGDDHLRAQKPHIFSERTGMYEEAILESIYCGFGKRIQRHYLLAKIPFTRRPQRRADEVAQPHDQDQGIRRQSSV